jgi:hypothetical protein
MTQMKLNFQKEKSAKTKINWNATQFRARLRSSAQFLKLAAALRIRILG